MDTQNPIYREDLMEEYKHPSNKGHMDNPTVTIHKANPMCGDEISLQLKIEDGVIKDAKFEGTACMVSIVSSSKLTEHIKDMEISAAEKISKQELLDLIGLNLTTSRIKCATLALDALTKALEDERKK
jgi:nitrogen fixation protein NifU and related proteins